MAARAIPPTHKADNNPFAEAVWNAYGGGGGSDRPGTARYRYARWMAAHTQDAGTPYSGSGASRPAFMPTEPVSDANLRTLPGSGY